MNIATWSIRNPVPAILFFVLMTLAGLYGFNHLPIQLFPDVDLPVVDVALTLPGAKPAQLENEVARKVEDALASLSGVKHIQTTINEGSAFVTAEFFLEKPLNTALIEVKEAVDSIRSDLPANLDPPTVAAVHIGSFPILTFAVSSPTMSEEELSWFVDNTVSKSLLTVRGVGTFERIGGVQREIHVDIDPVKLSSFNLTVTDVSQALKLAQVEVSGGKQQLGLIEQTVRTSAAIQNVSDLEQLPVFANGHRIAYLHQVATIHDSYEDRKEKALLDGKPVVGFHVFRAIGHDEVSLARDITRTVQTLQEANPNLTINLISNTVDYSLQQYHGSMDMLYEGALLAILVVGLFLWNWRATIISAMALPLSIIPTFAVIYWLGFSLNMLTLLAQSVVVGILVDDAIVEVENIIRHAEMGKPIREAAIEAVNEIALAVIATTFALVVVFVPTALMGGASGLFFRQFGWTIVISVLTSLLVARLITPVMAITFLKSTQFTTHHDSRLMTKYLELVTWCVTRRRLVLMIAVASLALSLLIAFQLPEGFMPSTDKGYTNVSLELPPGTPLETTLATTEDVRAHIADIKGILHVFSVVGALQFTSPDTPPQQGTPYRAAITLVFAPQNERRAQEDIEKDISEKLEDIPGARTAFSTGSFGEKMVIPLSSDNPFALNATALKLTQELRAFRSLKGVTSNASLNQPEINISPNIVRATELGISNQEIADTVRIATVGDYNAQLPKLNLDERQISIRTQFAPEFRQNTDTLRDLKIRGQNALVPLLSIATLSQTNGPSEINRINRHRTISITADLGNTPLGEVVRQVKNLPVIQNMPSSVHIIDTGDVEIMSELFSNFSMAISVGLLCIFCVLALLFKSFFQPITILSALPLALSGAILALVLTHGQMNLPVLIGIIMLMGIVTKNSILLVEYTVVNIQERGMSKNDAILDACHKRARPIVMTTVAMTAGMLPVAFGLAEDSKFRQPMAITVIGGLVVSTALSLFVVPIIFSYIEDVAKYMRRKLDKNAEKSQE